MYGEKSVKEISSLMYLYEPFGVGRDADCRLVKDGYNSSGR